MGSKRGNGANLDLARKNKCASLKAPLKSTQGPGGTLDKLPAALKRFVLSWLILHELRAVSYTGKAVRALVLGYLPVATTIRCTRFCTEASRATTIRSY